MKLYTILVEVNCGMDPDGDFDIFYEYINVKLDSIDKIPEHVKNVYGSGYEILDIYECDKVNIKKETNV